MLVIFWYCGFPRLLDLNSEVNLAPVVCVAVTSVACGLAYCFAGHVVFPTDDAFITLHNARVLWLGSDPVYKGVPALVGATSGVHLALLMAFELLIPSDTTASFLLSTMAAAAYVLGLFSMSINACASRREATMIALAGLVLGGSFPLLLLNGLETGLAMAAVAWNIKLLTDPRRSLWLAALCGIMPFIRPELAFLSAGSVLLILLDRKLAVGFKIKATIVCASTALPFFAWYWISTGSLIPSTIGAKTYFFAEQYLNWSIKADLLVGPLSRAVIVTFPLLMCAAFIRPVAVRTLLLLFAAFLIGVFFWRFPGGFWHNNGRYLFPLAPIVLFGVACGLRSAHRKRTIAYALISMLFVPIGFSRHLLEYRQEMGGYRENLIEMVDWMNRNIDPGSLVMVHDAGYVAYAGHFKVVDLVGLKSPPAADVQKEITYPSAGRLRSTAVAQIAKEFQPQYLMIMQEWDQIFSLLDALRTEGWGADEIHAGTAAGTPAKLVYHLFRLTPPREASR